MPAHHTERPKQYTVAHLSTVLGADIVAKDIQSKTKEVMRAGVQEVKSVAADALGAAGAAAAGVVLDRVAERMTTGAEKVEGSKPKLQKAIHIAVAPRRKQSAKKAARKQAGPSMKTKTVRKAETKSARKKR